MTNTQRIQKTKVELILPDGNYLKSKAVFEKGRYWRNYSFTSDTLPKLNLPLFSGLTSGDYHVVALDFDELPKDYTSYDQLIDSLFEVPGLTACHSPSGKAKGFFLLRHSGVPSTDKLISIAETILPDNLRGRYDVRGLTKFLVNESMANHLSEWLRSALVIDAERVDTSNIVSDRNKTQYKRNFNYHLADAVPEAYAQFVNRGRKGWEAREKFCRIVLAAHNLIYSQGWGLSQRDLADYLEVPVGSVNAYLKAFQANGWLTKIKRGYIVGIAAQRYCAVGILATDIKSLRQNYVKRLPLAAPKDGEFYRYFLSLSKKLTSWQSFKLQIESLNGITEKGRFGMAKAIWECDRKREARDGKSK